MAHHHKAAAFATLRQHDRISPAFYYLAATAGLGIFWVARMDLPVFDLHYLFGYCVLLLLALHVYFQRPHTLAFFGVRKKGGFLLFLLTALCLVGVIYSLTSWPLQPVILPPDNGDEAQPIFTIQDGTETNGQAEPVQHEPSFLPVGDETTNSPRAIRLRVGADIMTAAEYILHSTALSATGSWPRLPLVSPGEFRTYPENAYIGLPPPRSRAGSSFEEALLTRGRPSARTAAAPQLSLAGLSDALYYANGVTEKRQYPGGAIHLRAAPSAGALYPIDLFLAVRTVSGLAPGFYYYHPLRHALARVGGPDHIAEAARATAYETDVQRASAVIIASGAWDRTAWKYNVRSYRYVLMDLGHIVGNLTLALAEAGQLFQLIGRFDDERLTGTLGVVEVDEAALLMVAVGVRPLRGDTAALPDFREARSIDTLEDLEPTRRAHHLTSWRMVSGAMRRPAPVFAFRDAVKETIVLPAGTRTTGDLFETIRNRRSYRDFARTSLPLDEVTGFLRDVWGGRAPSHGFPTVEGGLFLHLYLGGGACRESRTRPLSI